MLGARGTTTPKSARTTNGITSATRPTLVSHIAIQQSLHKKNLLKFQFNGEIFVDQMQGKPEVASDESFKTTRPSLVATPEREKLHVPQRARDTEENRSQILTENPSSDIVGMEILDEQGGATGSTSSLDDVQFESGMFPYLRVEDAWKEFEARLEADLQTVASTLLAIFGVILFNRGVWSLLDHIIGDNPVGDLACVLVGLGIVLYIKLANLPIGSFWPNVD